MNRALMRVGALAGAATLATVTAAPGYAATVSKATASAITFDVAGMEGGDSGTVTATNDGSGQQKSGMSEPPAPAVPSMGALDLGLLAQDAEARVVNGQGRSAACAGIVGNDGSVLQVGEGFCLTPGDDAALDLDLGALELPDELGPGEDAVRGLVDQVLAELEPLSPGGSAQESPSQGDSGSGSGLTDQVPDDGGSNSTDQGGPEGGTESPGATKDDQGDQGDQGAPLEEGTEGLTSGGDTSSTEPSSTTSQGYTTQNASYQPATVAAVPEGLDPEDVTRAVQDALAQLDDLGALGVSGSLGAVQAICNAGPGLSGDAQLANAGFTATLGGEQLELLALPANPAPNTHLTTDLSDVVRLLTDNLRINLGEELQPLTDELGAARDELVDQVVDQVVTQLEGQLGPLEENILDVTLNKQTRSNGTIRVTALDAQVLPAAAEELGASLVSLQLGDVTCGGGTVAAPAQGGQTPKAPAVPTAVSAGQPASDDGIPAGVIAGILALLGASGLVGYRRLAGH